MKVSKSLNYCYSILHNCEMITKRKEFQSCMWIRIVLVDYFDNPCYEQQLPMTISCNKCSEMASENVIGDLFKEEKYDKINYDQWHRRSVLAKWRRSLRNHYNAMEQLEEGSLMQHRRDAEAYQNRIKKAHCACFTKQHAQWHHWRNPPAKKCNIG